MSQPSPLYLLLSHPAWAGDEARSQVTLDGLRQWPLDLHEAHQGVGLIQAMMVGQEQAPGIRHNIEAPLLEAVAILVERGAPLPDKNWIAPGSSAAAAMLDCLQSGEAVERALLAGQLVAALGQEQSPTAARRVVTDRLVADYPWPQKEPNVQGLPLLLWLALRGIADVPSQQGWGGKAPYADTPLTRRGRLVAQLIQYSGVSQRGTELERLIAASVLMTTASTIQDKGVREGLDRMAENVLTDDTLGQSERLIDQLMHDDGADYPKAVWPLCGRAIVQGLAPMLERPERAWDLVARSLPLFEDSQQATPAVFSMMLAGHGVPGERFWDALPADTNGQHTAAAIFGGSYLSQSPLLNDDQKNQLRCAFLDQMGAWTERHGLAAFDIEGMLNNIQRPNPSPEVSCALETYRLRCAVPMRAAAAVRGPRL